MLPDITAAEARDIAGAGLRHLARLVLPDGRFIYAHEADDIDARHEGYNLLRHCGTLWFMTRAEAVLHPGQPDEARLAAIARAIGWAGARMQPPAWSDADAPLLGLVGKGAIKLGGVGLALLMLGEAARLPALAPAVDAALPLGLAQTTARLRAYALSEIEGDDFRHKRDATTGAVLPFRSDYYTGEAIFGLLTTGPASPDLCDVITALMARRYGWAEQSHWMAYAACEAVETGAVTADQGLAYLTGLAATILDNPGYRARRASTPIACRTEALTRMLALEATRPGSFDPGLVTRLRRHAAENLDVQLGWYGNGQFWKDDTDRKVQIDYVQHNAMAFLTWSALPAGDGTPPDRA